MPATVLFVCTGNTCRSPMAEVIAKSLDSGLRFKSRGINVLMPSRASENAISAVLLNFGLDLSSHCARQLEDADMDSADLILTMTSAHKQYLDSVFGKHSAKIYCLGEYAGSFRDITDPFGRDIYIYRECADELKAIVAACVERIQKEFS